MDIAHYIDHTLLKPVATKEEISRLCEEAIEYDFYAVCVNTCWVPLCKGELKNSPVKLAATVGFPLGAMSMDAKIAEAKLAVKDGADEIDMVLNIGQLRSGNYSYVEHEIREIKKAIGSKLLKVILETGYLSNEEKESGTDIACRAGADFVKTSTGFGSGGATLEDITLMKAIASGRAKIKASGGIKDYLTAMKFIKNGADRIGTSNGIEIIKGQPRTS